MRMEILKKSKVMRTQAAGPKAKRLLLDPHYVHNDISHHPVQQQSSTRFASSSSCHCSATDQETSRLKAVDTISNGTTGQIVDGIQHLNRTASTAAKSKTCPTLSSNIIFVTFHF
jgi:hypothetical protein